MEKICKNYKEFNTHSEKLFFHLISESWQENFKTYICSQSIHKSTSKLPSLPIIYKLYNNQPIFAIYLPPQSQSETYDLSIKIIFISREQKPNLVLMLLHLSLQEFGTHFLTICASHPLVTHSGLTS